MITRTTEFKCNVFRVWGYTPVEVMKEISKKIEKVAMIQSIEITENSDEGVWVGDLYYSTPCDK